MMTSRWVGRLGAAGVATLATAALVLAPASPAQAAGNSLWESGGTIYYFTLSNYTSSVVIRLAGGVYTVDDTIPIQTAGGSGCSHPSGDQTYATCAAAGISAIYVNVSDRDDSIDYWAPPPAHLLGGNGNDYIIGGDSDDTLEGGPGNDTLNGWTGDDWLYGGPGSDDMYGGTGANDEVSYLDHSTAVTASLDEVVGNDGSVGEADTIRSDVEHLEGGVGDDTLTGNNGPNLLRGAAGVDHLYGLGGNDTLQGDGQAGSTYYADYLYGGVGIDAADYYDHTVGVVADLDGATGDDGATGEGDTIASDVENINGGFGNDTLTGNTGANVLNGRDGADILIGLAGNDTLTGAAGADTFDGGPDTDSCDYVAGLDVSQVGCE